MLEFLEMFEFYFAEFIEVSVLFFEVFGVGIIVYNGILGINHYFKKMPVQLTFSKGLALGMLFLLIGEILHSVVATSLKDLIYIGLLVLIRMYIAHSLNEEIEFKEEKTKKKLAAKAEKEKQEALAAQAEKEKQEALAAQAAANNK